MKKQNQRSAQGNKNIYPSKPTSHCSSVIPCNSQILVLGGGAAGIAAAVTAAECSAKNIKVTVLERNPRIGKKLLATGNGRCNLGNTDICTEKYISADNDILSKALTTVEAADPIGWFRSHGLLTSIDKEGRIYPYSNQASDVLNLLLLHLKRNRVEIRTDCRVTDISADNGSFSVTSSNGDLFRGDAVICAFGGHAAPKFGSDGFAAQLAQKLGLAVYPERPALVPLSCDKSCIGGLSGIRIKAEVTLSDAEAVIAREKGEVQFTDYGLSGIVIMQMSNFLNAKNRLKKPVLHLNVFPEWSRDKLFNFLLVRADCQKWANGSAFMTGLINQRIAASVWKAAELGSLNRPVSDLTRNDLQKLTHTFTDWKFTGLSPLEWQQAQTTGGGISLREISPTSFSSYKYTGLYFVGESLDCTGMCGGFNLHWAFGSGITAGRHAADYVNSIKKKNI